MHNSFRKCEGQLMKRTASMRKMLGMATVAFFSNPRKDMLDVLVLMVSMIIGHSVLCYENLKCSLVKPRKLIKLLKGGIIAASMPGMQSNGVALTTVPKIKYLIIISGGKFGGSTPSSNGYLGHVGSPVLCADSFSSPVKCPSPHIIGEKDTFMGLPGTELVESFVDPVVIKHRHGHTVIRPNPTDRETILSFIEKMEKM
ncbi:hypothetical protein RHSIM_Rhsim02G0034000 [Rhododendron simsii]|uniref:Serine hydrolase domain-containing protein n=1 Tax=Rhododendron simsii TaxID=118357 RepID=A0A834HNK9_RHOSS|nr:hypothetical protein RHSIM_Rhsim02G0034000 [Rhododendron simsii]